MDGYNWIRMRVTKANGSKISLNFDIHDASNGINDSWIFFGDSITAGSMGNAYGTGFAAHVNKLDNRFFPVQENGGIGGITSHDGKENIDKWLSTSCAKYVSIAYGTNDAWGNPNNIQSYYENTKYMIDAVLKAGKVPVLPTIPYASDANAGKYTVDYNAKVTQLYNEYGDKLLHGPDFYAFFNANPSYLSQDGVHPSSDGYEAMRKLWAETMIENLYSKMPMVEIPEDKPDVDILMGDVNGDKKVNVADAVLFQKWLLAVNETKLDNPAAADVLVDNVLDVYDMILLRKLIVGGSSMSPQNSGGKYEKVYEAEDAAISGGNKVDSESSASGGEYVGNFAEDTDGLSFEIEVPSDGIYTLTFTSKGIGGDKINNVYIDNDNIGEFESSGEGYTDYSIRRVMLTAGKHIVSIKKSWGWIALDKLTISTDEVN